MSAAPRKTTKRTGGHEAGSRLVLKPWLALGLLGLVLALFYRKILLGDAWFWEDFLYYYYPAKNFAAVSFAAGRFPFWNPYTFSGMPFLADIQNAVLYLPHIVFPFFVNGWLHPMAVEYMVIAHIFFAGAGMYLLGRRLELDVPAAMLAGAAFMLSGFMVTHAIHQTVIASVSWLPWIALTMLGAFAKDGWKRIPYAAVCLAMTVFAGFPQVFFYLYLFAGGLIVHVLYRAMREGAEGRRDLPRLALVATVMVFLALGLAAIQLFPTIELAPQSTRASITFEKSLEGSLTWGQMLTMIVPKLYGVSGAEGYHYFGPGPYWHYWETCFYPGVAILLLAIIGLASLRGKPMFQFLAGMALLSLLIGVGDHFPLHRLFFEFLPGYAKFRNPARSTLLFALGSSLLAGLGVQTLLGAAERERKRLTKILAAAGGGILLLLLLVKGGALDGMLDIPRMPAAAAVVGTETTVALLLTLACVGLLVVALRRTVPPLFWFSALCLVWAVDAFVFGFTQNNSNEDPREYFRRTDRIVKPLLAQGERELFRINSREGGVLMFDRNLGMVYPLFLMEGYTPLAPTNMFPAVTEHQASFDLMNVKYEVRVDKARGTAALEERTTYMPRVFFMMAGKVCPTRDSLERYMSGPAFPYRRCIGLEEALPFPLPEHAGTDFIPASIDAYTPNGIDARVQAPADGVVVYSELYYPGWRATVDGVEQPVVRVDGCLRGVPVRAGAHAVHLWFTPPTFVRGAWVSGATLLIMLVWVVAGRRRPGGAQA